jgi:nucleotide-binding universal stress UspA family protein
MVAVPHQDVTDATLYSLREAVARSLGIRPGARLAVVTVISPSASSSTDAQRSETTLHRQHRSRLKQWAQPLDLHGHGVSYHVLEASDVAQALVRYAEGNHVGLMILGAATHGLQMQRLVATVPMRVARDAPVHRHPGQTTAAICGTERTRQCGRMSTSESPIRTRT